MLNSAHKHMIPASEAVIEYIAENMREEDVAEVWASSRNKPLDSIMHSLQLSDWYAVIIVDNDILGICGLVTEEALGGAGVPWFLSTNNVNKHSKTFIQISRNVVDLMQRECGLLANYVHAENRRSIRYLRKLGFEIEEVPENIGAGGEAFYKFSKGFH